MEVLPKLTACSLKGTGFPGSTRTLAIPYVIDSDTLRQALEDAVDVHGTICLGFLLKVLFYRGRFSASPYNIPVGTVPLMAPSLQHPQTSTTPPTSTFTGMTSNPLGQGGERGWDLTQVLVKCPRSGFIASIH